MHQLLFDDIAKIPEGRQERNIFLPELVLALDPDFPTISTSPRPLPLAATSRSIQARLRWSIGKINEM